MAAYEDLGLVDFDHIEFAVSSLETSLPLYEKMGFEKVGVRDIRERALRSVLLSQGNVFILLSHSDRDSDPVAQYVSRHGEGVFNIAFRCNDAFSAVEIAGNRGAQILEPPRAIEKDYGSVQQASIQSFGLVRHTFVSRRGNLFGEGFDNPTRPSPTGLGLKRVNHISAGLEKGQLESWATYYERVFGLKNVKSGSPTAETVTCEAQSPDKRLRIVLSEGSSGPIPDFLKVHHGPGIGHLGMETDALEPAVAKMQENGVKFRWSKSGKSRTENMVGAFYYEIVQS